MTALSDDGRGSRSTTSDAGHEPKQDRPECLGIVLIRGVACTADQLQACSG